MGYKIIYGPSREESHGATHGSRLRIMTAAALLVFCLLTHIFWPEGAGLLNRILIPGEPTVSEIAFQNLMKDLREGESVSDAVTVFCTAVVRNESKTGD